MTYTSKSLNFCMGKAFKTRSLGGIYHAEHNPANKMLRHTAILVLEDGISRHLNFLAKG